MGILGSLYSAISGLRAHGSATEIVGDNIANANTIGYKASRGRFEEILGVTVGRGAIQDPIGQGSRLGGVEQLFSQGALLGTGIDTDLAIEGDGFFLVSGSYEGVSGDFFTRAGQFSFDAQGYLNTPEGLRVQGYAADQQGNLSNSLSDLLVSPNATVPPVVTTAAEINLNFDAGSTVGPAFDPLDPSNTSNHSTSLPVYDSLGNQHTVDVYFRLASPGNWEWHALVDGGALTAGTPGTAVEVASGTLGFDVNGSLDTETTIASNFNFNGAAQNQVISFDFGDSITTDGGSGTGGSTGYGAPFSVINLSQNGSESGSLAAVGISDDGVVTGIFTNGSTRGLAQIGLARFRSNEGLLRAGSGLFLSSVDSGLPLVGTPGTGGRGQIASGNLEQSNVDLSQELVNLIVFQRGFQASSRTITTADEMLEELVNLKR